MKTYKDIEYTSYSRTYYGESFLWIIFYDEGGKSHNFDPFIGARKPTDKRLEQIYKEFKERIS